VCGLAGRFGTEVYCISFIASEADQEILNKVQSPLEVVNMPPELTHEIDMC
jgi:hypothetical protein